MITVFSKASLPVERGVGRIYSQSRGRGHKNFSGGFAPRPPPFLSYSLAPQSKKGSAVLVIVYHFIFCLIRAKAVNMKIATSF